MSEINLNPQQQKAVEHYGTPLLILAGAGSGKTRVLTNKVSYLIDKGHCQPENILAVTFTNKAAREMKERVAQQLPPQLAHPVWVSTFHSLGAQILRKYGEVIGLKSGFTIYDDSDQTSVLKKVLKKLEYNDKIISPKFCKSRINMMKSMGLNKRQIASEKHIFNNEFVAVFNAYEEMLKQSNAADFGDLIYKSIHMIEKFPEVKEDLRKTFKYIMVDEYQDTNHSQYRLMTGLCDDKNNICVVGDEDQSIYGWRGADISNILNFENDFPNTTTIKLEQNYRSTQNIIAAAHGVISNNSQRHDKKLFTENETGNKVKMVQLENEHNEARFVADQIKMLIEKGISPYDIAVFYRTNAQSRLLEEHLRNYNISYRVFGGMRFYDRKEVKDLASYLNLLLNPADDVAFKRVVNSPPRGLGKTTIDKIEAISINEGIPMVEASIRAIQTKAVHKRAQTKMGEFLDCLVKLRSRVEDLDLYSLYNEVLQETGYLKQLEQEDTVESQSRIENLQEFGNAILRFTEVHHEEATLEKFLADTALVSDTDQEDSNTPTVTLMTLHISKGLEFSYVFIVGLEEGLFPSAKSLEEEADKIEEERRLCYVGMTRARKDLYLTHAKSRRHWGEHQLNPPSRFLNEIPAHLVEVIDQTPRRPNFYSQGFHNPKKRTSYQDSFDEMPDYENFSDSPGAEAGASYRKGMKVRHPVFGAGAIHQVEGSGDSTKISIVFQDRSIRKFVAKHANLTII